MDEKFFFEENDRVCKRKDTEVSVKSYGVSGTPLLHEERER